MTKQEILERAIFKAIKGGYKPDGIDPITNYRPTTRNSQTWVRWFNNDGEEVIQDIEHVIFNHQFGRALWPDIQKPIYNNHYIPARGYPGSKVPQEEQQRNALIYEDKRYDLPEAMFSCVNCKLKWNKCFDYRCEQIGFKPFEISKLHLQAMVIADDPIAYLGKNL